MLAQQSNSQRQEKVSSDKAFRQEPQRLIDTDTMPADRGADEPNCDCASTSSSHRPLLLSHFDPLPFAAHLYSSLPFHVLNFHC